MAGKSLVHVCKSLHEQHRMHMAVCVCMQVVQCMTSYKDSIGVVLCVA